MMGSIEFDDLVESVCLKLVGTVLLEPVEKTMVSRVRPMWLGTALAT